MNQYAILEKLAQDVASHMIFKSWSLYVIIAILSLLGTIIGSYLGARASKNAEVAAAKENLEEIKRQLKETTTVSKSVEVALNHSDWIKKEDNSLKRQKLEQLITAAFAIAKWSQDEATAALVGNTVETHAPIDEFDMLAQLYFPELKGWTQKVESQYRSSMMTAAPIRLNLMGERHLYEACILKGAFVQLPEIKARMESYTDEHRDEALQDATAVYKAVQDLCAEAFKVMNRLTSEPSSNTNAG